MTHFLIARPGYDEVRLEDAAERWMAFSRPYGSSPASVRPGGRSRGAPGPRGAIVGP